MTMEDQIRALEQKLEQLSNQVGILEDIHAVRTLHHKYGYYIDKCLYNETIDLFAEDGEVRFMGGIFKGKEGLRRLYIERFQKRFTNGENGPRYGFLLEHPLMQDIVDISPDRKTAKLRARSVMQAGNHELAEGPTKQWWEGGYHLNEYVKEDGIWKIKVLDYRAAWHADFENGWAHTPPNAYPFLSTKFPEDPLGPDEVMENPKLWPETDIIPFHYPHPVTGKWVK